MTRKCALMVHSLLLLVLLLWCASVTKREPTDIMIQSHHV